MPASGNGVPLLNGPVTSSTPHLVVEVASRDPLSAATWIDVTGSVEGISITRGDPAGGIYGGHQPVGTLRFRLRNRDGDGATLAARHPWSSWNVPASILGAPHRGLYKHHCVRVGVARYNTSNWQSYIVANIVDITEQTSGSGAVGHVDVVAYEAHSVLAGLMLDDFAPNPTMTGLDVAVDAILDEVNWEHGSLYDLPRLFGTSHVPELHGGQRFSGNALDTIRRIADAAGLRVACTRYGRLMLTRRYPDPMVAYPVDGVERTVDRRSPAPPGATNLYVAGLGTVSWSESHDDIEFVHQGDAFMTGMAWASVWTPGAAGSDTLPTDPAKRAILFARAGLSPKLTYGPAYHLLDLGLLDTGGQSGGYTTISHDVTPVGAHPRRVLTGGFPSVRYGNEVAADYTVHGVDRFRAREHLWSVRNFTYHEDTRSFWELCEPCGTFNVLTNDIDDLFESFPTMYGHLAGWRLDIIPGNGDISMTWNGTSDIYRIIQ